MEQSIFKKLKIVIPTRNRYDFLITHNLFPSATLVCVESEAKLYEKYKMDIVCIPDNIYGLGNVRNWILKKFDDNILVMADDDISHVWCGTNTVKATKITDAETVGQIVQNTAQCSCDAGTTYFGFNQFWDVRRLQINNPFELNTWIGCVMGFIGRDITFDGNVFVKDDVDFSMQVLLKKRFVWVDKRYSFVQKRNTNVGGNSCVRGQDRYKKDVDYLCKKWGKHYNIKFTKKGETISKNVKRKQSIQI